MVLGIMVRAAQERCGGKQHLEVRAMRTHNLQRLRKSVKSDRRTKNGESGSQLLPRAKVMRHQKLRAESDA